MSGREERLRLILEDLYTRGSKPARRVDLRLLALLSILLSVSGLVVVVTLGQAASAPLVKIGDVYGNFLMNYATVRVRGKVTSLPYVDNSTGRLLIRFPISDGTGELMLYIYSPLSAEALRRGLLPLPGDIVDAEVQLRVRESYTYGIVQALSAFRLEKISGEPVPVKTLSPGMAETLVEVKGSVSRARVVGSGVLLEVDTGGGYVDVLVPKYISMMDPGLYAKVAALQPGSLVRVRGIVYLYKGSSPEVVPRGPRDVEILGAPKIVEASVAELPGHEGEQVRVVARIAGVEYLSDRRGYRLVITDSTGSGEAFADRSVMERVDPFAAFSSPVLFEGRVEGGVLVVSSAKPLGGWNGSTVPISSVTPGMKGRIVVVKGSVAGVKQLRTVAIATLRGEGGELKLFMPGSVYAGVKDRLREGATVTVAGYVDVYRGQVEIVLYTPLGVRP